MLGTIDPLSMTGEILQNILKRAEARADKDGVFSLPEGTTLTLYLARAGVPLTVQRVESLHVDGGVLEARIRAGKRETFLLELADVFAIALDGAPGTPPKRAGFG